MLYHLSYDPHVKFNALFLIYRNYSMAFLQYYPRRNDSGIIQHHSKMIIVLWILMSTSYGLQVNKCCLESQLLGMYVLYYYLYFII